MPINPKLKPLYPSDWRMISYRIRFERAHGMCERCGAVHLQPHPVNGKKTVLTVAHLNHDPSDNREENLACLCARCHLKHDLSHHIQNAKETRRNKRKHLIQLAGQKELWNEHD